jgi:hypothetical protein
MKNTYYVTAEIDGTSKGFYVEACDFTAATHAAIEEARLRHSPNAEVQVRVVQLLSDNDSTTA